MDRNDSSLMIWTILIQEVIKVSQSQQNILQTLNLHFL